MKYLIVTFFLVINIQIAYPQRILNPLNLEYTYQGIKPDASGVKHTLYFEKNNPPNSEGDYGWTKAVPLYSSHETKQTFEYQLDFSDNDFYLVKNWMIETFGHEVYAKSMDNPHWYNDEMSLTDTYRYCRDNNSNITLVYWGEKYKDRMIIIIIESGSIKTNTQGGLAILYTFLWEPIKGQTISKTNEPKNKKNFNLYPNYDNTFDERYLGKHLFCGYFLDHYDSFGSATITKNNEAYELVGYQKNKEGDWFKIDGTINITSLNEFMFSGTLHAYMPSYAKEFNSWGLREKKEDECYWSGSARFITLYEGAVYWRMQSGSNGGKPCFGHLGDVDLFFD